MRRRPRGARAPAGRVSVAVGAAVVGPELCAFARFRLGRQVAAGDGAGGPRGGT